MKEQEINPCPFCNSKVNLENINPADADEEMYMFECTNDDCASSTCFGDYSTDRDTAIKKWNKRVNMMKVKMTGNNCTVIDNVGTITINH